MSRLSQASPSGIALLPLQPRLVEHPGKLELDLGLSQNLGGHLHVRASWSPLRAHLAAGPLWPQPTATKWKSQTSRPRLDPGRPLAIFIRHLLQLVGLPSPPHWHADIRGRVASLKPAPGKDQVTAPSRLKADPVGPGREDRGTGSVAG